MRFVLENWDINVKNAPKDDKGNVLSFLNVGTGKDITIKLTLLIAELIEYKGEILWDSSKPDGTKRNDVSKIHNLGWKSKISLKRFKENYSFYKDEISKNILRSFKLL